MNLRGWYGAASEIPPTDNSRAISTLETGGAISAQDTVPFCLWCAAHNLNDFEEALWTTIRGFGDVDTTCAVVGGIVALPAGGAPSDWVVQREPIPDLGRLT